MKQPSQFPLPASPDRTFVALQHALGQLGYTLQGLDPVTRTIAFNTGLSWKSWNGQDMLATVVPVPGGTCVLQVDGQLAKRGLAAIQVFDWGEKSGVVRKVVERLHMVLPTVPEPAPVPPPQHHP